MFELTSLNRSLELDRLWPLWLSDDVDTLLPGLLKDCTEFEFTTETSLSPPSLSCFKSNDDESYTNNNIIYFISNL